jgi:hypothetical protein
VASISGFGEQKRHAVASSIMLAVITFMKILLLTLLPTLITVDNFGQIIPAETGDIKVEITSFSFKITKDYDLTKRTMKTGLAKYYFDSKVNLIEEVHFGKYNNNNLKLLDRVEQYYYATSGQLTQSKTWDTDYDKNISQTYYTNYKYDNENRLVDETTYDNKDSVFMRFTFEYSDKKSITRVKSQTTIREYDNDKRIISKTQLLGNEKKINWTASYSYVNNCVIEDFHSYWEDKRKDYSKKKTECYTNDKLVEIVEYYVDTDRLNEKTNLIYGQEGILEKIEKRRYSTAYEKYELEGFIKIQFSGQRVLDIEAKKKLNKELIDLLLR